MDWTGSNLSMGPSQNKTHLGRWASVIFPGDITHFWLLTLPVFFLSLLHPQMLSQCVVSCSPFRTPLSQGSWSWVPYLNEVPMLFLSYFCNTQLAHPYKYFSETSIQWLRKRLLEKMTLFSLGHPLYLLPVHFGFISFLPTFLVLAVDDHKFSINFFYERES